jgi:hypothetical protein
MSKRLSMESTNAMKLNYITAKQIQAAYLR